MAAPHGVAGQFGYKTETTNGTAVTVDTFLPINSAPVKQDITHIVSNGMRAGRLTNYHWKQGTKTIAGRFEMELWNTDIATLFNHMFGAVATATNGAQWDYTYTPGDLTGQTFTAQVGIPDQTGTVRPFTWAGCKIRSWTLRANVGEAAMLSLDMAAMSETNGTALASASYDSDLSMFVFTEASLTIGGTAETGVQSLELTGDNGLTERFRLGSATSREYLENAVREYAGTAVIDFESLTAYTRFLDGDEAALVATFDNDTEQLVITMNVRFTGESPELSGVELVNQTVAFAGVSATNDAGTITAVLTNGEGLTGAA